MRARGTVRSCACVAVAAVLAGTVVPCGCVSQRHTIAVPTGPLPSVESIEAAYNARVAGLERIWARATVRFQSVDSKGDEIDEQGEGYLQIIRPHKLYWTVGPLSDAAYELGSDERRYWWIDVRGKSALIGDHENATPERVIRAGLPVHPLELLELLGITPLKIQGQPRWSDDGRRVEVRAPGRWGERVLSLEPTSLEPVEVELLDREGEVAARAELGQYEGVVVNTGARVGVEGVPSATARLATRVHVDVPVTRTQVTLWVRGPEDRGSKMKARAFDFELLAREFGVTKTRSLDDGHTPTSGTGS